MPPFKDEHILIVAPGSQTTLAQLGLPESYTPARLRVPTRMFPAEKEGEWEPIKVREKRTPKKVARTNGLGEADKSKKGNGDAGVDVTMTDGGAISSEAGAEREARGASNNKPAGEKLAGGQEEVQYEEDPSSEGGAVWPMVHGRIVNWSCFFALFTHVYNTLSPPFHTPILLILPPAWTEQDKETLTQFIFEKFKTPAFCLMDAALAACYAYGVGTATVVDVGFEKTDVTAVNEFDVEYVGRGIALEGCGGEGMTQRLLELLRPKDFTRDMCEKLKRNPICEILPAGVPFPTAADPVNTVTNPAAAASTGAAGSGPDQRHTSAAQGGAPRGPGINTEAGVEDQDREFKDGEDNEGVLDVASIVASGKTSEFLAKKEKEKAEKAAAKKATADAANAPKIARLPNSQRVRVNFHYEVVKSGEDAQAAGESAVAPEQQAQRQPSPELTSPVETTSPIIPSNAKPEKEGEHGTRRSIEVGLERFKAADGGILERIGDAVHRAILSVPEVNKRSEMWECLIILGNGSRVKGFKEALLAHLTSKYLISPSSATMFTSELPSNISTPLATGTNTPNPHTNPALHHGSGVNPLLLAATTASNPNLAPPSSANHILQQHQHSHQQQHSSHAQSPTTIKIVKVPEYFPEWKEVGMEEAAFLGAQVAAKVVFVVDQGVSKGYMSRTEYNEMGPQGIHESCL